MGTYILFVCLLLFAFVKQGLQQPTLGSQQGLNPGEFSGAGGSNPDPASQFSGSTNTGGLSNSGFVENSANPDMGLGGAVFRLGSAERNLNPELRASLGNPDFRMSDPSGVGNVAVGLFNQPVQPPNTPSRANHVIQKDLQDTVIVHNFLKGGLQQMLMGRIGNQPEVRNINQVNQINKLINSPKKIQDAFPDQKLVNGNSVAVGSSGTAVGASFKDPTQHANDLPSFFTPSKTKVNDRNLIDFSNHICKGNRKEHQLSSKRYWVVQPKHKPHLMTCPVGTEFTTTTCACTHVPTQPKVKTCKPDLINTFDYGMDDSSGNYLAHFATKDLKPVESSGILCFNGSQEMGYPRYRSYDFSHSIYIVLRFITYVDERDQLFPLLTNCESDKLTGQYKEPSIGIVVNRTNDLVVFVETENGMSLTSFAFRTGEWNTVTLHYNGNMFTASLNGQSDAIPTTGNIEIRHAPLTIGYCERYGYFDGCVDDIYIFPCIPHRAFINRLKGIA
ncbi:asparagine-rich protein-like isoform X2 [Mizuhopecten yessoensis]|uniref:asparagine-rich protein-like isoform X2 n=1 Tax=Mizuhopecten yessoensis TaxID=6573 RepID=UPI000B458A5F|nr:asparagine-rich protein-like isoform X2 [Mizuhopecten yessoensis]